MSRIEATFKALNRPALITFIMAGDPDAKTSLDVLKALPEAGADIIELGMPFTDPMADGPTIQLAGQRALKSGANMKQTLQMVRDFRKGNNTTPIVLMGYFNPILQYGVEKFMNDASAAGVDGLIIVDLPPEEAGKAQEIAKTNNLDIIRLLTPTTTMGRLPKILEGASGFLYYVSITGVTGAAQADLNKIKPHIEQIKTHTDLPIAIGFGIKTPQDAAQMAALGDAIVVGSSIVQTIAEKRDASAVSEQVKALSDALS
ncbi:MAG TPA: tryptophan synthase subunit alpha [Alphaproteobacteria bacterium]|nr:tryptophan synthase subunit alpha [Alphaproteobacteria bacterium]USO05300.1 MAG: tryptophan synthase subunit alpha [Rhodospirillales bacterium]HOO81209.1 tryptophan synthase subunit alpha [Alphaproteobacteria bacterium]